MNALFLYELRSKHMRDEKTKNYLSVRQFMKMIKITN